MKPFLHAMRTPLAVLALYAVSRVVFGWLTADEGLLTPGEGLRFGVAALGLVVLCLRFVVLFVLPAVVVHRLAMLGTEKLGRS